MKAHEVMLSDRWQFIKINLVMLWPINFFTYM